MGFFRSYVFHYWIHRKYLQDVFAFLELVKNGVLQYPVLDVCVKKVHGADFSSSSWGSWAVKTWLEVYF